jgi:integral membrane sensor domain MASE1
VFATLRDATTLITAVAVATGLLALVYVGFLELTGFLTAVSFGKSVAQYWIGDLIGIVVVTPALLVFTRSQCSRPANSGTPFAGDATADPSHRGTMDSVRFRLVEEFELACGFARVSQRTVDWRIGSGDACP